MAASTSRSAAGRSDLDPALKPLALWRRFRAFPAFLSNFYQRSSNQAFSNAARAAHRALRTGQRAQMERFDMTSPRVSRLANIFNTAKAQDAVYSRPGSATGGAHLSARPNSARLQNHMMMHPGQMSPRSSTPRSMTLRNGISPRVNDASAHLTDWIIRQGIIREMLGSAREHLNTPEFKMKRLPAYEKPEPTLVPAPSGRSPREMAHQRVWREAAERKERMMFLMEERQAKARARAQAAEAVSMASSAIREMPAELKAKVLNAQRKLKEWFLEENKRFRKVFRTMDEDHNGWVDRIELRSLPMLTNLSYVLPPPVLEGLIDQMDLDGDGRVLYNEFVRVIMADDPFNP